ncbi:MAG: ATP-dependent DNA helicase RecG [Eubacteriales bacterium]
MRQVTLNSSIKSLGGIGTARAAALARLGIHTVRDLLYHFPRAYEHRGLVKPLAEGMDGQRAAFVLTVMTEPRSAPTKTGLRLCTFRAGDSSGTVEVVFFNRDYVKDIFHVGGVFRFWGVLSHKNRGYQLASPQFEAVLPNQALPDYVSLYPLTEGLSQKVLASLVNAALGAVLPSLSDHLPESVRLAYRLPALSVALRDIHAPTDSASLGRALRRLMFDEIFTFALGIAMTKQMQSRTRAPACAPCSLRPLLERLPYELTEAQKRSVNELYKDMTARERDGMNAGMRRILIGDVGSGKTVCAAIALYIAVQSCLQGALMVPTEILARQHFQDLSALFEGLGIRVKLLTGSTSAKEKRAIYASLQGEGEPIQVIIGTHALLSDKVVFDRLGVTVTDEQHRFGVLQRAALTGKCDASHLLVMSATPIPRTMALALYGDLAVSHIDQMPPGRSRVDTFLVNESYRERLHAFIGKQVRAGGQVYIVCPSIEDRKTEEEDEESIPLQDFASAAAEEERLPLKSAVRYAEHLREQVFPEFRVELLHGKMKAAEKEAAMQAFVSGAVPILVSTTVIEVGVNVPNATLMIVENAERFGLSQLHQLRGRVGRGQRKSYCVLVSDTQNERSRARLAVMQSTYDGYEIAERDLAIRGPGDFLASASDSTMRQSGGLSLRLAHNCQDTELFSQAFAAAAQLIREDPSLSLPGHIDLLRQVKRLFAFRQSTIS